MQPRKLRQHATAELVRYAAAWTFFGFALALVTVVITRPGWLPAFLVILIGISVGCLVALQLSKTVKHEEFHVFIRHSASGEWACLAPGEGISLPRKGRGYEVKTFTNETAEEEVKGIKLGERYRMSVSYAFRIDLNHLAAWIDREKPALRNLIADRCVEEATKEARSFIGDEDQRYEGEFQADRPDLTEKGIEVLRCRFTLRYIPPPPIPPPPPPKPPEPDEPWEDAEGFDIGRHMDAPVYLDASDLVAHVQIIGASRFGKSKLMEYAARQLAYWGEEGLCLIDPNQQLYASMLRWCAYRGIETAHFLDLSDEGSQVGFNPFRLDGPKTPARVSSLADRLLATTLKALGYSGGEAIMAERILKCLYYMVIEQDLALTELQAFLYPRLFDRRDEIVGRCRSQLIRDEWEILTAGKKDAAYVAMMQSSANRLFKVIADEGVQRVLTNPLQLDIRAITGEGQLLFVNLKESPTLSEQSRNVIGTFLVEEIWSVVSARNEAEASRLPRFNVAIDEFHNFASPQFAKMLKEGAKYGLHFWLIHHSLDDLDSDVVRALRACYTRCIFGGVARKDAASILDGSRPMQRTRHVLDRSVKTSTVTYPMSYTDPAEDIQTATHLAPRSFMLVRAGKENALCRTAEVKEFPIPAETLRAYRESLTTTGDVLHLPGRPAVQSLQSEEPYDPPTVTYERLSDPAEIVRELRYATVEHVATILGDKSDRRQNTAKKLRALAEKGSLKKLTHTGRSVYCLPDAAEKHLEHELVITGLHVLLWDSLALWEQGSLKGDGINPDAFFATHCHFFLEAENSNPRSQDGEAATIRKARQYAEYADRRLHKPKCQNFRVLFVMPSERKARNLIAALQRSGIPNLGRFWASWGGTEAVSAKGTHSLTTLETTG